ncbi:hypothetical protein QR680_008388 [Steinernema hermaphroditum]|uniref:Uncharacterized protein n=1 Tax=Steinernema hermaphroditum TaxID=289476 RepID=A0AA39M802_9BILA|nr:hypothetical protein QR680_008388 [Steinernema hermaphroditum]
MRLLPVFLFSLLAISHAWNVPLDSEDDDSKENDLFTPVQKEVLEVIDSAMTLIENLKDDNWKKNFEQKGRKLFGNILKELFGIGNEETKHSRVRRAVRHEAIIPAESFDPLVSGTDRLEHVNSNAMPETSGFDYFLRPLTNAWNWFDVQLNNQPAVTALFIVTLVVVVLYYTCGCVFLRKVHKQNKGKSFWGKSHAERLKSIFVTTTPQLYYEGKKTMIV